MSPLDGGLVGLQIYTRNINIDIDEKHSIPILKCLPAWRAFYTLQNNFDVTPGQSQLGNFACIMLWEVWHFSSGIVVNNEMKRPIPGEEPASNHFRGGHGEGGEEGQAPVGVGHLQPEEGVLLLAGEVACQEWGDSWQQKIRIIQPTTVQNSELNFNLNE